MLGTRNGKIIGWKDDRHMLTIAGSRAGKGVSLIIPNLIFYGIIDPKGENAALDGRHAAAAAAAPRPGRDRPKDRPNEIDAIKILAVCSINYDNQTIGQNGLVN